MWAAQQYMQYLFNIASTTSNMSDVRWSLSSHGQTTLWFMPHLIYQLFQGYVFISCSMYYRYFLSWCVKCLFSEHFWSVWDCTCVLFFFFRNLYNKGRDRILKHVQKAVSYAVSKIIIWCQMCTRYADLYSHLWKVTNLGLNRPPEKWEVNLLNPTSTLFNWSPSLLLCWW